MRKLLEFVALAALLAMFAMLAVYSDTIPDRIPTHFSPSGAPDRWGSKNTLWIFPAVGAVIYVGLCIGAFIGRQKLVQQMLSVVKVVTMVIFAVVNRQKLEAALGNSNSFNGWFTIAMIVAMSVGLVYARRSQREP